MGRGLCYGAKDFNWTIDKLYIENKNEFNLYQDMYHLLAYIYEKIDRL